MGFDGKTFEAMFQSEEDWKAFYEYMISKEMESLLAHEGFSEKQKRPAFAMFLKMSDVRTQAEYKAFVLWEKTEDYKQYAQHLWDVDAQRRRFNEWMRRRYADRFMVDSFDGHEVLEKPYSSPVTGETKYEEVYP